VFIKNIIRDLTSACRRAQ